MQNVEGLKGLATYLTAAGVLCITAACRGQADAPQAVRPEVDVISLRPQSIMLTTEVPGHTSAFLQAEIRPQVSGTILRRRFEEGTDVKAGQVLYQIDPLTYQVVFNSAKAELSLAEALAARLRPRPSGDGRVVEPQDDDADTEYKWAQADVVAARAELQRARIDLAATRVTAPISGRIGRSTVTAGDLVVAGQVTPLATVVQIDPIYVDVTLSSTDILHVMRGRTSGKQQDATAASPQVRLRLSDGFEYEYAGKLQFSEVAAPAGAGTVTLRAVFPNPKGELMPDMSARAQVQEGVRNGALLVPQQSVTRDATGQASVLVVNSSSRVEVRPITIERMVEDQWLIGAGLQSGERIVVDGIHRVPAGVTVTPMPSRAKPGQPESAPFRAANN
jgi:membrane fusion protein (multidrug efflux system)